MASSTAATRFLLLFFLLSAASATASAARTARNSMSTEESVRRMHEQWMVQHGRVYKDAAEKERRFRIFKANVEYIESANRRATGRTRSAPTASPTSPTRSSEPRTSGSGRPHAPMRPRSRRSDMPTARHRIAWTGGLKAQLLPSKIKAIAVMPDKDDIYKIQRRLYS
uniref:Cathepsin propeptide inhibitor domain-containing protein n=1 Tax=Ananas comosus var. bracteatus TaxID=296719 RepID=A0A6V7NZL4_ANACO|nr:unnamed protein product [Ananas comosus var. bracteatus]